MSSASSRNGYEDVETLRDAGGVAAVISRRKSNGQLSVGFFKIFDRDGDEEKTAFMPRRQIEGLRRLLPVVEQRMDELEDVAREAARTAGGGRR